MRRFAYVLAGLVLVVPGVSACADDGDTRDAGATVTPLPVEGTATPTTTETGPFGVDEVAPELAGLGDLAAIETPTITAGLGHDGGQVDLVDGATIHVPPGAFSDETSLSVSIVSLGLGYFDNRLGPARTYVIETDREVSALDRPVVLEIPFPTEISAVVVLEDGTWAQRQVSPGETTRVEISHFSKTLITFLPAGAEWLVEQGWMLGRVTTIPFPSAFVRGVLEDRHQNWVRTEADQSTRDFYGLDKNGQYLPPTHTQDEMCEELQAIIAGYTDFSVPQDYSGYRLGQFLFDAWDPAQQNAYPEFWEFTKDSMAAINRQVVDSATPLTPAKVLQIAIDTNGGNVPMGVLAAHNYLKSLAYRGREHADPGKLDPVTGEPIAPVPVPPDIGQPAAHLEPWRQTDPANPSGRLDKVGSLYHIFAAAVASSWGYEFVNSGNFAAAGEAIMRAGLGIFAGDVPDREKGLADECGARLGGAVLDRTLGKKPPPEPAPAEPAPAGDDNDGIKNGIYLGTVTTGGEVIGPAFQIMESTVELDVTDTVVQIAVDYTVLATVRQAGRAPDLSFCEATLRYTYVGQSTPAAMLADVKLQESSRELLATAGPECGTAGAFETTFEEEFQSWPAITLTLSGSFASGRFDGTLTGNRTPLSVTASA